MTNEPKTPIEGRQYGRALREAVPLDSHAEWSPGTERADPVQLIEEQNEDRIPWLVPVRRVRMAVSPFTFYRGSARIMAADLVQTPVSGLDAQICGDAHLANFGTYASPERRLVFDLNDFDETLPGPWEWDVKRLAVSFILAGRNNGIGKNESRKIVQRAVRTYRKAMAHLATMGLTDIWYSLVEVDRLRKMVKDRKLKSDVINRIEKINRKDSHHALNRLTEEVNGKYRIRSKAPLLIPLRDVSDRYGRDEIREMMLDSYEQYHASVPNHIEFLLRQYRPIDFAVKVVGVGSVGTQCYILLLEGRDRQDPLFLQIKQANRSVLEEHLPPSRYENAARRVVEGQRLMQTVSDIFLGHNEGAISGNHYYVRQLKDWKDSADIDNANSEHLHVLARNRGWTLARAHARTGDPIAISGYLGSGKTFDRAIVKFAERYAGQSELDYEAFAAQIESGQLEAAEYG